MLVRLKFSAIHNQCLAEVDADEYQKILDAGVLGPFSVEWVALVQYEEEIRDRQLRYYPSKKMFSFPTVDRES